MPDEKPTHKQPWSAPKERVSAEAQLRAKNLVAAASGTVDPKRLYGADGRIAGKPWDRIEELKTIAACLLEYPPSHPEKKRAEIARKIEEIHRLAEELLQEMPKTKSKQGAIGLD
jgi:hypothetical protein